MTYDYIKEVSSKIMAKFKSAHPGQPLRAMMVLNSFRKEHVLDYHKACYEKVFISCLSPCGGCRTRRVMVEQAENI